MSLMYKYCKRNKYIKQYSFGRNNNGYITIRARQGLFIKTTQPINLNYNYIFSKTIQKFLNINNYIKVKIIKKVLNNKLQRYVFKGIYLNSLLKFQYKYFPITNNVNTGDIIYIGKNTPIKIGNIMFLEQIPCGSWIHNIEHIPTKGATFVKNSKISAFIINKGEKYTTIKLPSGEIRLISKQVFCILGELNTSPFFFKKTKAGTTRFLGRRPKVRGVAMNACDHPHGGGEGKNSIGRSSSYSPWGVVSRGILTRNKKKYSTKLILKCK